MTVKFFSKELPFLKSTSDGKTIRTPETFLCDQLLDKTQPITNFEKRLGDIRIPDDTFLCSVIRFSCETGHICLEKTKKSFEETLTQVLDHDRGIWECLDESVFALAFWDYSDEKKALELLKLIKTKLSSALDADIIAGYATFPFKNYKKQDIFANAVKAMDHAAFFGAGSLQAFDARSLNISADRLYHLDQYDRAIDEYHKGLELDAEDPNLTNSLGVCYAVLGNLEAAEERFKQAVKLSPNDPMVAYNTGLLSHLMGDIKKAASYLRKAHGIDGNIFEVELLLGKLLFEQEKFKQSLPHLETAAKLNPMSGQAFRLKGEICLKQEEPEKAAGEFNTAIKLNPSDAISLSGYAKSLELQDKNLSIALSFAKNSVALNPDNLLFKERYAAIQKKLDEQIPQDADVKSA